MDDEKRNEVDMGSNAASGMNVEQISLFLTGGTGFFGRSILRYLSSSDLIKNGAKVAVLSRSPEVFLNRYPEFRGLSWLAFYRGDILSPEFDLPSGANFSHLIHAGADYNRGPRITPLDLYEQIVTGTRNVLEFAVNSGVRRFLLASSGGGYGIQPADVPRFPESFHGLPDPLLPASTYGISKRMAEHLCCLYQERYGLETVIARCFAFVGPDLPLDGHFAIGNFIRDALAAERITVTGNGAPVRSYLYQQDLAEWLMTLLLRGRARTAYNVGSDEAITIGELALLVRDILAPRKTVMISEALPPTGMPGMHYVPSIEKARNELGLEVRVPLAAAIRLTGEAIANKQQQLQRSRGGT